MRRKTNKIFCVISAIVFMVCWPFINRLPNCLQDFTIASASSVQTSKSKSMILSPWQIPNWVQQFNVSYLFDWTWHKNGYLDRCRTINIRLPQSSACKSTSSIVVNDVLDYFRLHPDEGCIVDNVARLPNSIPHPLPRARSLNDTCSSLSINHKWILCDKAKIEIDNWLPSTTGFVTIAVFNAFVDTGHCHSDAPGTVFNEKATYHLQRWTNNPCGNDVIDTIPEIKAKYQHLELIDAIGNYLGAPGHFGPQQLPRLLRLLATAPTTAKVLVAKGGIADSLIDVLVERGIVTRDRIIQFDKSIRPYYFASIVYYSESWPYLKDKHNSHYVHDRTDMQLVHHVMATGESSSNGNRDRIILIKRRDGHARSIIEHFDMVAYMTVALNESQMISNLHIEIFEAQGHIREHIALFRRARIIIGPHGAGMMNILWSEPGTHVVEIGYTTGMIFPEMYAEMSLHLDQHYWICKGYGDYTKPIHVDMSDFTYIFNQIILEIKNEDKLL